MRVAESGTSKLKNLPNLPKIDPCSEPWKRVTSVDRNWILVGRNWILIILTLHARSYPSCKNQCLDLLTFVRLTCQSQVEHRWNTGPAAEFVLISGVRCYTYNFKCPVSIRLKFHVCIPMLFSYTAVQLHGLNICGSLTAGRRSWNIFHNLPKIGPCSEPWKRVTFVVGNWILIVLTLHARSYPSCKNQRLDLLT